MAFIEKLFIQINRFLAHFNVSFRRLDRNFDTILKEIINKCFEDRSKLTIFDVGAHNGSSIRRFRTLLPGRCSIYSFEPSSLYTDLLEHYSQDADTQIFRYAISNSNKVAMFNEHPTSTGSSSLAQFQTNSYFAVRRNLEENVNRYSVECVSLDSFTIDHNIDRINLLKIDVQGYEAEVFQGMGALLKRGLVDIIEVEVILADAYQKRTSFFEIEQFLVPNGYRLIALSPDGRFFNLEPHDILSNAELEFDAIYVNSKIFDLITKLI